MAPDLFWKNGRFARRRAVRWLSPLLVFLGFGTFLVYANWAAWQNANTTAPTLPFYSPSSSATPTLVRSEAFLVSGFLPFSPRFHSGFRSLPFTCYYYGAYYSLLG
jgi:hypothetical protein